MKSKMRTTVIFLILFSFLTISASSGQKNNKKIIVTGLVTDSNQRPLVGALVLIYGKNTNVVTDDNGVYKLKVRPDADSITIVTFTSGINTEAINGRTNIDFVLGTAVSSDKNARDKKTADKKVDIGYGNVSEKDVLTRVNTIDGRNSKYATYKNIYEILKGTAGVIVKGNSVQLQGPSSFNSGTQPIFVVDGMIVESVDGISPAMVESISVLKGASASIYGSRGANGAILITLINGSEKEKK
jgi:TonB-dependent SusC/RagA subfamily outer membrane receptor